MRERDLKEVRKEDTNLNHNYYLRENALEDGWWTLSLVYYDQGYSGASLVYGSGHIGETDALMDRFSFIRPAVSLISGIELASETGDGTQMNPYRININ